MYHVQNEQAFREALEHQNLQHISGTIHFTDGTVAALNDTNLLGSPRIDTRIITDSETFNLSELYIGTLEFEFIAHNINETQLIGAEVSLQVQVELDNGDLSMPVPMGVWDIVSAPVQSGKIRKITAYDHIARLAVPLGDSGDPGMIQFRTVLTRIENEADIEFSQTIDELSALFPDTQISRMYPVSLHFADTCWLEVQYIAQYLGAYVIATRDGKIEFRKYNIKGDAVRIIPADQRFDSQVSSSVYFIHGIGYADKFGHNVVSSTGHATKYVIYIPQSNVFVIDMEEGNYENYYKNILDPIADEFSLVGWNYGSIDYYGDPTLDVGDVVLLTGYAGGVKPFMICQNTWQFRAPQTLVSGGPPRIGSAITASTSSGGGSVYNNTTINTTKDIALASLKGYKGLLFDGYRTAARSSFKIKEQTAVFITCTSDISGEGRMKVLLDNEMIGIEMKIQGTLSFTLPLMAATGTHSVDILICGTDELEGICGSVWGQEVSSSALTYDETDWEYTTNESGAQITGYTGTKTVIEIPEMLGNKAVKVICEGAFSDNGCLFLTADDEVFITSDEEQFEPRAEISVYIPDGVEKIE